MGDEDFTNPACALWRNMLDWAFGGLLSLARFSPLDI